MSASVHVLKSLGWEVNWKTSRREELLWRQPLRIINQMSPGHNNQVIIHMLRVPNGISGPINQDNGFLHFSNHATIPSGNQ